MQNHSEDAEGEKKSTAGRAELHLLGDGAAASAMLGRKPLVLWLRYRDRGYFHLTLPMHHLCQNIFDRPDQL
jgi:hypothetical protein